MTAMPSSRAHVATDRPERYVKQLSEHLGRRNAPVTEPGGVRLIFALGNCLMTSRPGELLLAACADSDESLAAVEDLVARHLVRIGRRDELAVEWVREEGEGADAEP